MTLNPLAEFLAPLHDQAILITGADGMLGRAFVEALAPVRDRVRLRALSRYELDVTDQGAVMSEARHRPNLILHCAALSIADECEQQPARARLVHVEGTRNIVRLAVDAGARIFYPQSFLIFDGSELPVTESTTPAPTHVYGRVKLEAEQLVLAEVPGSLVARLAGFFGGDDKDKNFVGKFVRHIDKVIRDGGTTMDVGDRTWQPTYTLDIARNVLLLLALRREGIYNVSALGEATFFDVADACVRELGLSSALSLQPVSSEVFDLAEAARRPKRVVMTNERLVHEGLERQRPWQHALCEYLQRPYFDQFRREPIDRQ